MPFRNFLANQAAALEHVRDTETLSTWHDRFANEWVKDSQGLSENANRLLGFTGEHQIRPELGYLAVERRSREGRPPPWILLCANPGWVAESNALERTLKGHSDAGNTVDLGAYKAYRTAFFERWYPEVMVPSGRKNGAGWWHKAVRFLHQIDDREMPKGTMALHPDFNVIGWDLWPFHSSRDGLSGRVADDVHGVGAFARASLKAALRMSGARGVIAASAAAKLVVDGLLQNEPSFLQRQGSRILTVTSVGQDGKERSAKAEVSSFLCSSTGAKLIVIDRQLFSNWGTPSRALHSLIVDAVRAAGDGERLEGGPELHRKAQEPCVRFVEPQPETRPLVISVPVTGTERLEVPDYDDDEEMHLRTVGFWRCRPGGPVSMAISAAFAHRQRVFVMSRGKGRILRLYEIMPGQDDRRPEDFFVKEKDGSTSTFTLDAPQPHELTYNGKPFASTYGHKGRCRMRFHARPCADELLQGIAIESDGVYMRESPAQCTFADLNDARVQELLSSRSE